MLGLSLADSFAEETEEFMSASLNSIIVRSPVTAPRTGVLAALWLPPRSDGTLNRGALARHLDWLKKTGIHGVLALGSTGEFVRMTLREREEAVATIVELAAPLPVLVNVSSIRLDEVIALGKASVRSGAVGAALMPPHFYPLAQADVLEFFLRAAERIELPLYLYNFPELAGNRIALETIACVADRAKLFGIKQSGGEFGYHRELVALGRAKNFSVFSGSDTRLPEVFALGADGAIGGLVNFVPELMMEIFRMCREGAPGDAEIPAARMREVGRIVDQIKFPPNVACGIAARGLDPGAPRTVLSAESLALSRKMVSEFTALFLEWGLPRA